jgi:succinyl-diaminopimelate desuccinylase
MESNSKKTANKNRLKILNKINEKKKDIINFCSNIIRIPSENPPGVTTEISGFLKDYLVDEGLDVGVYEPKKGIVNLVASFGEDEGPNLVFNAHMDTFPRGEENWPAFDGNVLNGKIIGRGASDMKGGLTASLFAFSVIHELFPELPGRLTLTLVSDEETGGKWGTEWITNNVQNSVGDSCIIGESTAPQIIACGEKGVCWLKITTFGEPGHGAHGAEENAIEKMSKLIPVFLKLREVKGTLTNYEEFDELLNMQIKDMEIEYGGKVDRILRNVTVNLGTIKGGTKINIVSSSCNLELDTRLPFGVSSEVFITNLKSEIEKTGVDDIDIKPLQAYNGSYTSSREKIVQKMIENVKIVTRKEPVLYPIRLGATDARIYRESGVPTVVYGPKAYNMAAKNEYITVNDLITTTKVHSILAYDFFDW